MLWRFIMVMVMSLAACGRRDPASSGSTGSPDRVAPARAPTDAPNPDSSSDAAPAAQSFATLADALRAIIPADTRVIGFGELHARVDRAPVRSALATFTEALPAIGAQLSDLVVETWIVDPRCGPKAQTTTRKLETAVRRPEATKSEIALLADAARAAQIQPHAMTLACKDYDKLAPASGEPDPVAMLGLVTRELSRIATSAVTYRDKQPSRRPWIAIYGGALHNDRFPAAGVAEWSYADTIDLATDGHYLEIDLIVPELADADKVAAVQPWFPLSRPGAPGGTRVQVWPRGERSLVVILPRGAPVVR